ncbi:MAG: hybrid sensor histidine kinase/response regulator [Xanthomonadaceae bacterium]|nr:hybrid sensor histidine kinase/response regulator [Xanthomonadaceae bacterium]
MTAMHPIRFFPLKVGITAQPWGLGTGRQPLFKASRHAAGALRHPPYFSKILPLLVCCGSACPAASSSASTRAEPPADSPEAHCRKSDFVAILAHELRHPLAPIRSGLDFLRMGGSDPLAVANTLDMMDRQLSQMTRLVDDLFDVVGISSGKVGLRKERVALKSVIANAIETSLPVIEAGRHQLLVDIADESLMIEVDPGRISQVMVNLLNNAAKYTPHGGRIELSVRQDERQVYVSVADNGAGISQASSASIFEMFSQPDQGISQPQGGLGIGLSLVRQLVELHGGTVEVTSAGAGQGSTFTVRLPLAAGTPEAAPMTAAVAPSGEPLDVPARGLRILVADDDAQAARLLATVLELQGCGHVVALAGNGLQAVAMAREFKPEVAFLDISMPGMDGYEAAQALRQSQGQEALVLVALTGWSDPRSRARASSAGFDHLLTKPAGLEAVNALLSGLAGSAPPAAVPRSAEPGQVVA